MKQELLQKYAELIVKVGANVQPGQYVVIRTNVSQEKFASIVVEECYKAGAARVWIHWQSARTTGIDYKYASLDELAHNTEFELGIQKYMTEKNTILIWLDADDPDGMKDMDAKKFAAAKASKYQENKQYIEARQNKYQWCIAGCPSVEWAEKVFPNLKGEEAIEALWEAILKTSRALDGNGEANWIEHEKILKEKSAWLNSLNLRKLKYKASNGTDLEVGLIPNVIFEGGAERTLGGIVFQPNIPTEESFTSPMRGVAEGIVYASKPLVYQGQIIENFYFRFHEGKAVECHAEKGQEVLQSILDLDEGSAYLGECALVPFDSPINQTGLLFFNTLYDENACCHLAIGRGFTQLYPEFEKYSEDELHSFGINKSLSHVDFMIGTRDLSIVGVDKDGKEIKIFENGTWAN